MSNTCTVEKCSKTSFAASLCCAHYARKRKYGDPLKGGPMRGDLLRFLNTLAKDPPPQCVPWPYGSTNGYGYLTVGGVRRTAHAVAYEIYNGKKIPAGMVAAHAPVTCHNTLCVNPLHIRAATHAENAADRVLDKTHGRGIRAANVKLTEVQVLSIRADPRIHRVIASEYGVGRRLVGRIKNRSRWGWL